MPSRNDATAPRGPARCQSCVGTRSWQRAPLTGHAAVQDPAAVYVGRGRFRSDSVVLQLAIVMVAPKILFTASVPSGPPVSAGAG